MYTEFSNWGKDQVVTMPNNMVSSSKIINLTKGNKIARINVYITVAYDTDIPKAKAIMLEAANHNENVVLDGSFSRPSVTLTDWLDSGIQLRLSCYVDDFDASKGITGALREKITQMFRDNGIEIPYTRVQIDILSDRTEC
jgi:small-conductance mechanosensitive channel